MKPDPNVHKRLSEATDGVETPMSEEPLIRGQDRLRAAMQRSQFQHLTEKARLGETPADTYRTPSRRW